LASGSFEETSLDWRLQQLSQQIGEWFEGLLPRNTLNGATADSPVLPEWLLKGVFWLIVVAVVAWASWQLYNLLCPYLADYWRTNRVVNSSAVLASTSQHTVTEWLQQARIAQQQGNYQTACRALYMATLQRLHDRGILPQQVSRTDGEYLSFLKSQNLPQPYQVLIRIHERLCFDQVTASPETYERCWQAYQEIERS
jgi:4-amino-4-deoxy-L-arabinose transferase-like glycosyltransferase